VVRTPCRIYREVNTKTRILVGELRISTHREHRVFFVARFHEAIYILHAFEKKSQATARRDIELGRTRYQALVRARAEGHHGVDGPR
jgi:phage-related protein